MFTVLAGHVKAIALAGTLAGGAVCGGHAAYTHYQHRDGRFDRPVAERRFDRDDHRGDRDHARFEHQDVHHDRR